MGYGYWWEGSGWFLLAMGMMKVVGLGARVMMRMGWGGMICLVGFVMRVGVGGGGNGQGCRWGGWGVIKN